MYTRHFDGRLAVQCGVNAAIVYFHFQGCSRMQEVMSKEKFIHGKRWIKFTDKHAINCFPYITISQYKSAIKSLIKHKVIEKMIKKDEKGNTCSWYAILWEC